MVSLSAIAWACTVAITGGFRLRIGPLRFSSQQPSIALVLALAAAVALVAATWLEGPNARAEERAWWRRTASRTVGWPRVHARAIVNAVPAILAMAIIGVRVWHWTAARPLWLDEEAIALTVRERSFAHLGSVWLATSAPLGWLVAERAAILVGGTGEAVLRLLPMLFGIAMLGTAVWIGRRWMSPIGATALVVLCGSNFYLALFGLEAKQYSADACWALVLPAMAVWAIEADTDARRIRRAAAWWVAAAIGQWLANGAAIVTPGCALVLFAASWRRSRAVAGAVVAFGLVWVGAALLHYQLSIRDTLNSAYFHNYWLAQFPPPSVGPIGALRWMLGRLDVLAAVPGDTGLWISLWVLALCGFVFGSPPLLGLVFATVPLTAFLLAGLRIVPLFERFVLWMVPALAVGLALILDRAVRIGRDAARRRHWLQLAIAAAIGIGVVRVCADVVFRGKETLRFERPGSSNHGLDDRAAVRWLMAQRQPGDAIVAPPLAWPAVWWYGDIPIGDAAVAHGTLKDGGSMLKVTPEESGSGCADGQLRDALKGHRRVLVYLGFPGFPPQFGNLVLQRLEELGSPVAAARFAEFSRAEVIELHSATVGESPSHRQQHDLLRDGERLSGCVGVQPAVAQ
ncbi:MAG TPA: hypothetical protein VFA59_09955 [Vicinamibacterales bacterium]|nr:hypothetical protein [Vicinamibacterales bacterium]